MVNGFLARKAEAGFEPGPKVVLLRNSNHWDILCKCWDFSNAPNKTCDDPNRNWLDMVIPNTPPISYVIYG